MSFEPDPGDASAGCLKHEPPQNQQRRPGGRRSVCLGGWGLNPAQRDNVIRPQAGGDDDDGAERDSCGTRLGTPAGPGKPDSRSVEIHSQQRVTFGPIL